MRALETLKDIARNPARVAEEWKASGKKVVGYRCLYIPEEVIWAADMLPYPLYGTPEPVGLADAHFQSCTCEFVRNIFDHALAGKLEFLDGLALANTCDVVRRLYDIWLVEKPETPVFLLNNPQKLATEKNRDYFLEELRRFRGHMEELSGNKVSDERLRDAILDDPQLGHRRRTHVAAVREAHEDERPPSLEVFHAESLLVMIHQFDVG